MIRNKKLQFVTAFFSRDDSLQNRFFIGVVPQLIRFLTSEKESDDIQVILR